MKYDKIIAIGLETVGSCAVLAGIILEVTTGAAIGYIVITGGALTVALGSMLFAKLIRGAWRR